MIKFIRQAIALFRVWRSPEYGGILYDFVKGEEITRWNDDEGLGEGISLVENALHSGRDFVYIAFVKSGRPAGYFVVHSSCKASWTHAFWPGIYSFEQAYRDTLAEAKKQAEKLGFKLKEGRRDET